ncbi:uncharacterized protein LOC103190020 [Callorhinchus milii]|uniref:uncharacterized protein LOC103190020 n=1 Tax=Callorhinchus milii TaxID=7868 RepID=UPI0004575E3A|nr:uncharacterized protein LOC103190020 [Callorhinchus milii]|eukprot:gi/632983777/ref/XP_007908816.1/ PREDICTED: uncharacterized protein LOC103190020 [Callorhinchus milii]
MEIILFLLLCQLFSTSGISRLGGSKREKNPTDKAIITQSHGQTESKSVKNNCANLFHPLWNNNYHVCNSNSSCGLNRKRINLMIWVPYSISKHNDKYFKKCKDYLKCLSTKKENSNQRENRTLSVTSSYTIQKLNTTSWVQINCSQNHSTHHARKAVDIELFVQCPFNIRIQGCPHNAKKVKRMERNNCTISFKDNEDMKNITFIITGSVNKINLRCLKENDTLPRGTELMENQLKFKGPMKKNYTGMYLCVASYQHCQTPIWWEIKITSDEWTSTNIVLITICLVLLASAFTYYIFRWRRRKQLIVIPQQYSIQNPGYQNSRVDIDGMQAPQHCREGVISIDQPKDSREAADFIKTTLDFKGDASSCNVSHTENVNPPEVSQQTTDYHKFDTYSGT